MSKMSWLHVEITSPENFSPWMVPLKSGKLFEEEGGNRISSFNTKPVFIKELTSDLSSNNFLLSHLLWGYDLLSQEPGQWSPRALFVLPFGIGLLQNAATVEPGGSRGG